MTPQTKLPLVLTAALSVCALVALTGCSDISDAVHNEASATFSSMKELKGNWDKSAEWVPTDSTKILTHESTKGAPAILSLTSASQLDPSTCTKITRLSGPDFSQPWAPKNSYVKDAWACGAWDVIPTKTGWFGWTPNAPKERAAAH